MIESVDRLREVNVQDILCEACGSSKEDVEVGKRSTFVVILNLESRKVLFNIERLIGFNLEFSVCRCIEYAKKARIAPFWQTPSVSLHF